ncbi:MAG: SPOR domain-containing protein [Tannerella sp.]|jgi:hypothetical protein|nr:SPOR domain-containing protein [Tannerella sp.]
MDRIVGHIEKLLFRHDCVIVPEFGGLVLQTVSAVYTGDEHRFIPARKEIVYNPTLTHNDGLLAQSYMQTYIVDFDKAQQMISSDVALMKQLLDKDGSLRFGLIGSFVKNYDRVIYQPDKKSDTVFSIASYGLPTFHYLPLTARNVEPTVMAPVYLPTTNDAEPEMQKSPNVAFSIPITRTFLRIAGMVAAAIVLFFAITKPVKDVNASLYSASFVPLNEGTREQGEQLRITKQRSALANYETAFGVSQLRNEETRGQGEEAESRKQKAEEAESRKQKAEEAESRKQKAEKAESDLKTEKQANNEATYISKPYFVIIGSGFNHKTANNFIEQLDKTIAASAGILERDGKVRVYAQHFANKAQAQAFIVSLQKNSKHKQAWLYTYK